MRGPLGHIRLALLAILTASCAGGDAITEVPQGASIAVNATFPEGLTAAAFAQASVDRAEIKIFRGETEVIAQRTLELPGGFNQTVDLVVMLEGDTEDLDVRVEIFSGTLLAYGGGVGVTAVAGETVVTPEFTLSPRAPIISITTGQLTFTEAPGSGLLLPISFELRNDGIGTMSWSSSTSQTWLSVSPTIGDVGPGLSQIVQLRASKAGLAPGTHTATVQINGSGIVGAPVSLDVTLNVAAGRQLSVVGAGTGNGNVSSNPAGIACAITAGAAAGACASTYNDGTAVTLTAAPNSGSTFAGWSGAGCAGISACQVTLTQTESVTATFNLRAPSNQDPTARFTASCSFLTCSFDGTASSDPDGTIQAYAWSFGDGAGASGATTSHTFASSGSYNVSLTVTDSAGATNTTSRSVTTGSGGSITGQVFVDLNGNDTFDGADTPLSGATVSLSRAISTTTDASGSYSFGNLSPGSVSVSVSGVSSQYVYGGSQPQPISVTVTAGQTSTADFPYDLSNPAPAAPSNVAGIGVSEFELDLIWTDQSTNEDLFEVELRQENTTTWLPQGTTGPNVEVMHLGNLPQGTSFDARVRACRSGSCSVWVRSPQLVFTYLTPPDPSNVQITSADASAVTIIWQDNSFTETSFVIEHGSLTSAWVQVGTVGPNVTTFTDLQNTKFGEPIFYRVAAVNSFGRSGESPPDSVTIPPPGQAPVISNISYKLVRVNDTASCSFQSPVGSLFEIVFDYDDLDGDVNSGSSVLQNDWAFNPQRTGTFYQPPDPGLTLAGEGGIGTGYSLQCHTFVNDQVVNVTLTLYDDAGLPSNPLSININRPSGANAPAGAPPVAGSSAIASGGAKPSNE